MTRSLVKLLDSLRRIRSRRASAKTRSGAPFRHVNALLSGAPTHFFPLTHSSGHLVIRTNTMRGTKRVIVKQRRSWMAKLNGVPSPVSTKSASLSARNSVQPQCASKGILFPLEDRT